MFYEFLLSGPGIPDLLLKYGLKNLYDGMPRHKRGGFDAKVVEYLTPEAAKERRLLFLQEIGHEGSVVMLGPKRIRE